MTKEEFLAQVQADKNKHVQRYYYNLDLFDNHEYHFAIYSDLDKFYNEALKKDNPECYGVAVSLNEDAIKYVGDMTYRVAKDFLRALI